VPLEHSVAETCFGLHLLNAELCAESFAQTPHKIDGGVWLVSVKVTNWEWMTCYKCEKKILVVASAVHPLCDECDADFDEWFNKQLEVFK
jgi:hypothetical protein